jgi:hypothetical protein
VVTSSVAAVIETEPQTRSRAWSDGAIGLVAAVDAVERLADMALFNPASVRRIDMGRRGCRRDRRVACRERTAPRWRLPEDLAVPLPIGMVINPWP